MATYYVSATDGSDSDDGSTAALAKATIGAGENLATSAGDIVYIAPGTYRETVTHGYSGTAANRIYITWKNVQVDGGSGGVGAYNDNNTVYGFYSNSEADHMEVINCMTQHCNYGTRNVAYVYDSVIMSFSIGCAFGYIVDRCVIIAAYTGAYYINLIRNSVVSGYYGSLSCDKVVNCTAFMGSTGFRTSNGDYVYDSVALCTWYGFFGGTNTNVSLNGTISGSLVSMCRYTSYYGKMHGLKVGSTYNQWLSGRDPIMGKDGATDMQGDGTLWDMVPQPLYNINNVRKLADVVTPTLSSVALRGVTTTFTDADAGATDFYGNPRKMGSTLGIYMEGASGLTTSSRDLGHVELVVVEVTGSVSSSQPGFSIVDEGIFRIPIAVSASSAVTASIGLRHNAGSGTAIKPQFVLRYSQNNATASATSTYTTTATQEHLSGSNLYIQSVTSTAADNVFETISVSGSFTKQTELELLVINQQTGSDSISTFSDLEIT